MMTHHAAEQCHRFRYGELLEEASRARLARAAEAGSPSPFRRLADAISVALIRAGERLRSKPTEVTRLSSAS